MRQLAWHIESHRAELNRDFADYVKESNSSQGILLDDGAMTGGSRMNELTHDDTLQRREFLSTLGSKVLPAGVALCGSFRASGGGLSSATATASENAAKPSVSVIERIRVTRGGAKHRAFPSLLRLKEGSLLLMYREGNNHWETDDSILKLTRSTDDGKTWTEPRTLMQEQGWGFAAHHGAGQLSDGSILAPAIALRHHAGPFFDFRVYALRSSDGGDNWNIKQIGPLPGWVWQNQYGRLQEIDGELWLPGGGQREGDETWYTGFFVSRDNGKTWPEWRVVAPGRNEKDILELRDGRLLAMIRGKKETYRSYSSDRGKTWSPKEKLDLYGQSPSLLMLPSGNILFAYRQVRPKTPFGVGLAVSTDSGGSWRELDPVYVAPADSHAPRDCAYPSLVLSESGEVLCAYYTAFDHGNCHIALARIKVAV